jgi:TonB family protein
MADIEKIETRITLSDGSTYSGVLEAEDTSYSSSWPPPFYFWNLTTWILNLCILSVALGVVGLGWAIGKHGAGVFGTGFMLMGGVPSAISGWSMLDQLGRHALDIDAKREQKPTFSSWVSAIFWTGVAIAALFYLIRWSLALPPEVKSSGQPATASAAPSPASAPRPVTVRTPTPVAPAAEPAPAAPEPTSPTQDNAAPQPTITGKQITNPDWLRKPTGDEMEQYYPDAALRMNLKGSVVLYCLVRADGALEKCYVGSESPAGYGFGSAALRMTGFFRMRPLMADGVPVGGAQVSIPIDFATTP